MKKIFLLLIICLGGNILAYTIADYSKDLKNMTAEEKQRFFSSADDLKCPTCTGLSVLGSEAAFSMQIRKKVVELIKKKKNDKEIKQYFTERYGLWILRAPPKSGFHLLVWMIPSILLFSIILGFLWFVSKNKKAKGSRKDFPEQERFFLKALESYQKSKMKEV